MNIAFVWTAFTSYMADCWRELSLRNGVNLKIWIGYHGDVAHCNRESLMKGLTYESYAQEEITRTGFGDIENSLLKFAPDVIFICGWSSRLSRLIAKSASVKNVKKILCCDMPWEWRVRKFAARFILMRYIRLFDKIFVPGMRARRYARWLGFEGSRIFTHEYCVSQSQFRPDNSEQQFAKRGLIFVGRLVKEKNVSILARAYAQYRNIVDDPMSLDVYGVGDEVTCFQGIKGVFVHGYASPDELSRGYNGARALVLPSKWEPWGQVVAEAMSCGCPVLCSDKCGVSDIVSNGGIVLSYISVSSLMMAIKKIHDMDEFAWERMSKDAMREISEYNVARWADVVLSESESIVSG